MGIRYTCMQVSDRQTDRQSDRQTGRQAGRQTDRMLVMSTEVVGISRLNKANQALLGLIKYYLLGLIKYYLSCGLLPGYACEKEDIAGGAMSKERLHSKNFVTPCLCLWITEERKENRSGIVKCSEIMWFKKGGTDVWWSITATIWAFIYSSQLIRR